MKDTMRYDNDSPLQLEFAFEFEDCAHESRAVPDDNAAVCSVSPMSETEEDGVKRVGSELLEQMLSWGNLHRACERVIANKGAAGTDGMEVTELLDYLECHGDALRLSLLNGTYKPQPVRRVEIPKPDGGKRLLGVPTVVDRVVQQAVAQVLSPIFEQIFSDSSYGFRPGRSAQQAVERCRGYINEGYTWVVDIDLAKFFDTVQHDKLIRLVSHEIKDGRVISLVRKFLVSGVMIDGVRMATEEGTPQGGNISPLLSNVMLHELDKELEKRGLHFCRYADDCNIYVKSKKAAERVMKSVTQFLDKKLHLKVNQDKSAVGRPEELKFLGFRFYYNETKNEYRILVHEKSAKRFKAKLKELTKRNWGVSTKYMLLKLKQSIHGWVNYFCIADMASLARELDSWVRRRIRAVIWKQCKCIRGRRRMLMRLSKTKAKARQWANTRKGYWRISKSPILHETLTNNYLSELGLVSIATLYSKH